MYICIYTYIYIHKYIDLHDIRIAHSNTLQHTAITRCNNTLQSLHCWARCSSALTAKHRNNTASTLQHYTATLHCNTSYLHSWVRFSSALTATYCNTLQHSATTHYNNTLQQHTATTTHCNTSHLHSSARYSSALTATTLQQHCNNTAITPQQHRNNTAPLDCNTSYLHSWVRCSSALTATRCNNTLQHIRFAFLGAVLFSAFIVYDTQQIMTKMGCDDYVSSVCECVCVLCGGGGGCDDYVSSVYACVCVYVCVHVCGCASCAHKRVCANAIFRKKLKNHRLV